MKKVTEVLDGSLVRSFLRPLQADFPSSPWHNYPVSIPYHNQAKWPPRAFRATYLLELARAGSGTAEVGGGQGGNWAGRRKDGEAAGGGRSAAKVLTRSYPLF